MLLGLIAKLEAFPVFCKVLRFYEKKLGFQSAYKISYQFNLFNEVDIDIWFHGLKEFFKLCRHCRRRNAKNYLYFKLYMTINTCKTNQNQNSHFWKVRCLKNKATTNLSNFSLKLRLLYLRKVKYFSRGLKVC